VSYKYLLNILIFLNFIFLNNFATSASVKFYNQTQHILKIDYKVAGVKKWCHEKLNPGQNSGPRVTAKEGGNSRNIDKIIVCVFDPKTYIPLDDIKIWSRNVFVKDNQKTNIYFNMVNNKLVRKISCDGKMLENYDQFKGLKNNLDYLKILLDSLFNGDFNKTYKTINSENLKKPRSFLRLEHVAFLGARNPEFSRENGYKLLNEQYYGYEKLFDLGVRAFILDGALEDNLKKLNYILKYNKNYSYLTFITELLHAKKQQDNDFSLLKISFDKLKNILDKNKEDIICVELHNYFDKQLVEEIIKNSGVQSMVFTQTEWDIIKNKGEWPNIEWLIKNNKRLIIYSNTLISDFIFNKFITQISNVGMTNIKPDIFVQNPEHDVEIQKLIKDIDDQISAKKAELPNYRFNSRKQADTSLEINSLEYKLKNLHVMKHLATINLFPEKLLKDAQVYLLKAISKIRINKLSKSGVIISGLDELIKAFVNIKLYWSIDYNILNEKILSDVVSRIINNGLYDTKSLKGQVPNFIYLDQINWGNNPSRIINSLNTDFKSFKASA